LIAKKMKHWWMVAKCRLIDPIAPHGERGKTMRVSVPGTRPSCRSSG
jgi:hypothetical protein